MKWVIDYNTKCIKHFAFVLNGEETWVHWGEVYLGSRLMLLVT
jgi:hypothetical protein